MRVFFTKMLLLRSVGCVGPNGDLRSVQHDPADLQVLRQMLSRRALREPPRRLWKRSWRGFPSRKCTRTRYAFLAQGATRADRSAERSRAFRDDFANRTRGCVSCCASEQRVREEQTQER